MPAGQNHSNFALNTRLSAPRYDTWCKIQVIVFQSFNFLIMLSHETQPSPEAQSLNAGSNFHRHIPFHLFSDTGEENDYLVKNSSG
jgi:hypothetical protein